MPVSAGSLAVSPLRLTISDATQITALTVENHGRDEALVQAETFAWRQQGAEHLLTPTEEVVAVPPVFRLAPGARQQVRVGLTRRLAEKNELTFRLTVTEVPTAVAAGSVMVAVRHSVPIFVRATSPVAASISASVSAARGLEVANVGNEHARIHRWRLRAADGAVLAEESGPGYLLAGAVQRLNVAVERLKGARSFEVDSDSRTLKIAVGE